MAGGLKYDAEKIRMELIPVSSLRALGTVLTYGAKKYSPRNWEQGIAWGRCYGALLRHLTAWWGGESLDPETGYSHLWHAMCNLAFLIEFEETSHDGDDRPNPAATHGERCEYLSEVAIPPTSSPEEFEHLVGQAVRSLRDSE
jgi:hypothetical protein